MNQDYRSVTEIVGDKVTQGQVDRLYNRYYWAKQYCLGKDVAEVACGSGPGLGYIAGIAGSFEAGDCSDEILSIVRRNYGKRINLRQFDAQDMPFKDNSKDVIIMFEAIYYIPDAKRFVRDCKRVLRSGGKVLISTANKDLFDFNPSPYSHRYYGVVELNDLFAENGFRTEFFGDSPIDKISIIEKIFRPIKKLAVIFKLIPNTMAGKKFLKRIIFGKLVSMPFELAANNNLYQAPTAISAFEPDRNHKIIFCEATID